MNRAALRTSPLHSVLEESIRVSDLLHGMATGLDGEANATDADAPALCDASAFPRFGICGRGAPDWLATRGIAVPETVYAATALEPDGFCMRLGRTEFVLEDGPEGRTAQTLAGQLGLGGDGVYGVIRQDAQILLRGRRAAEVLAQVCGVDFREPADRLVMTRLAGVSCAVLPRGALDEPWYRIWVDASYAVYLWQTLLRIVREMDGGVAGLADFFPRCSDLPQQPAQAAEEHSK